MGTSLASVNGRVSLSAVDFLGLTRQRKVQRLDLAEIGYEGVIYIRDLTAAEQVQVTSGNSQNRRGSKARLYADESVEMDITALSEGAGPQFLRFGVVTDAEDGAILERAFETVELNENGEPPDYITIQADMLVQMADTWIREAGNVDKMIKRLEQMPNAITNHVVRRIRTLSGMGRSRDQVEEKKENS
jgi:hypothetical protein